MRERVRREFAGTKLLRQRDGRADLTELVECREERLLRITAGEAALSRRAEQLRAHLREARARVAAAALAAR
jgi:hypothetical protein